jgi:hypothetical protein
MPTTSAVRKKSPDGVIIIEDQIIVQKIEALVLGQFELNDEWVTELDARLASSLNVTYCLRKGGTKNQT